MPRYQALSIPSSGMLPSAFEHPVGIGQDLTAGEEVRHLRSGGACQRSEIVMRGPRTGLDQSQRLGDELLDIAEVYLASLRR